MNQLLAEITDIQTSGEIMLITLFAKNHHFQSLIIQQENDYLFKGNQVYMIFKETELSILKGSAQISLNNQFPSIIKAINQGKLLTEITLDFQGEILQSIITTASLKRLDLALDNPITGLLKTNELMLMRYE